MWGDTDEARKLHLINWKTLTLPKQIGGLGIKDLPTMNKVCFMKLAWGLKTDNIGLWYQVLNGKCGRGTLPSGTIQAKVLDSSLWKLALTKRGCLGMAPPLISVTTTHNLLCMFCEIAIFPRIFGTT